VIWAQLLLTLLAIFAAAEIFTNALEHLGEQLGISEGVTGSIFAAVGTAMPETVVPILAIVAGTSNVHVNEDISVGAILGAPLMLSTLSLFVTAVSVLQKRGTGGFIAPERTGLRRDLHFFLISFGTACAAFLLPANLSQGPVLRSTIAILLLFFYFIYVLLTVRASARLVGEGHATEAHRPMFLSRIGLPESYLTIAVQLAIGLVLLVGGAKAFIENVRELSDSLGVSASLLSILIVPIATELPEKINSVLWLRRGKDTLAMGNITGAMVFQGSVLPALGLLMTSWHADRVVALGAIITLVATLWLRWAARHGRIPIAAFAGQGLLYATFLTVALV
jgi:cation:H+ antiporter